MTGGGDATRDSAYRIKIARSTHPGSGSPCCDHYSSKHAPRRPVRVPGEEASLRLNLCISTAPIRDLQQPHGPELAARPCRDWHLGHPSATALTSPVMQARKPEARRLTQEGGWIALLARKMLPDLCLYSYKASRKLPSPLGHVWAHPSLRRVGEPRRKAHTCTHRSHGAQKRW